MCISNKLHSLTLDCATCRAAKENDYNGKQKLACLIVSKDRSYVLRKRDESLQC
jgi:hypothetical protein